MAFSRNPSLSRRFNFFENRLAEETFNRWVETRAGREMRKEVEEGTDEGTDEEAGEEPGTSPSD